MTGGQEDSYRMLSGHKDRGACVPVCPVKGCYLNTRTGQQWGYCWRVLAMSARCACNFWRPHWCWGCGGRGCERCHDYGLGTCT
eukprot:1159985-Pelagomonas_calceolata.AAC.6